MSRKQERYLPRRVGRFNYWEFFRPDGIKVIAPLKRHLKRQFHLILTASPTVWNKEIRPWLHRELADIPDRQFLALEGYVLDDKEWRCDGDAWDVYDRLSVQKQKHIRQLDKKKWGIQRVKLNWDTLLQTIAADQARFEAFLDTPDTCRLDDYGTERRIYAAYHAQANKLLWPNGGMPPKLTARREAKKTTLHWFHHALRNMREYRNRRPPIPWSPTCTAKCASSRKKLSSS